MISYTVEEIKKILESAFDQLLFEEETHTYQIGNKILPSVSKKLTRFYDAFDAEKIVIPYQKKWNKENPDNQKSREDILNEWKRAGEIAAEKGSEIHAYAEEYPNFPEPKYPEQKGILEFFKKLPSHYEVVYIELRMHNHVFAGTADLILLNKKTNKLVIADWKTNKDLFKNFKKKKLLIPFKNLLDTPINKYKIQLNHYKMLIEDMTSLEVEDMWLIWLTQETDPSEKAMVSGDYYIQYRAYNWTKKLKQYYGNLEIHI